MNVPRKHIYFASDAHLGARFHQNPQEVEKKLVRWLDSIKAKALAVYFLGQIVEYPNVMITNKEMNLDPAVR